jgi:uncharacterized protein YndB with AHSA1/START domain
MKANSMAPVTKQILVEASQERAFRVFTQNIEHWWPAEYHIGKTSMKAAVIEPKKDGRWYEKGEDGSECDWGKVLVWEPPHRLVLAWQITATWQYDPALVTELEVKFTPRGPKQTFVELEHRKLEAYAASAEQMRGLMDGGWSGILSGYAEVARDKE